MVLHLYHSIIPMAPSPDLHIFLFPLMAPGHTNPMLHLARLLTERGARATVLTTTSNAPYLRSMIDSMHDVSGDTIDLLFLRAPSPAAGDGSWKPQENLTSLPTPQITTEFFNFLHLLCQHPLDEVLTEHRPDCLIFDSFVPWATDAAGRRNLPSFVFHAVGFFSLCASDSFRRHKPIMISGDAVLVPGLPRRIEMKVSQLPSSVRSTTPYNEFADRMVEAELKSCGAVVNSFYEMEPEYAEHYREKMGRRAWNVGPVCLRNRICSPTDTRIIEWLDSKPLNSVVYVCFGSLCRMTTAQLHEIAIGLEASGHPFIWAVREDDHGSEEERVKGEGKGLIVRGWAPQAAILNHRSVGGFVTHCGWNSVTEAVSAGVPMVTWPLFAEQFYNEKLVVEVLGVGVSVGAEVWSMTEEEKPVVVGEVVGWAIDRIMGGGGDGVRRRATELAVKARRAVEEGGSSHIDLGRLMDELAVRKGGIDV